MGAVIFICTQIRKSSTEPRTSSLPMPWNLLFWGIINKTSHLCCLRRGRTTSYLLLKKHCIWILTMPRLAVYLSLFWIHHWSALRGDRQLILTSTGKAPMVISFIFLFMLTCVFIYKYPCFCVGSYDTGFLEKVNNWILIVSAFLIQICELTCKFS